MKTLNCSELLEKGYTPTPPEAYAVLGNWGLFLAAVESLMVLTTVAVFVHECHYLSACWPRRPLLYSSLALSVFPVSSIFAGDVL